MRKRESEEQGERGGRRKICMTRQRGSHTRKRDTIGSGCSLGGAGSERWEGEGMVS